jgi:hypothetical protein
MQAIRKSIKGPGLEREEELNARAQGPLAALTGEAWV